MPLDGLWLRAPYLHNGSVPNLRALLDPPAERPRSFWRGSDLVDPGNGGFVSTPGGDAQRAAHGATTRECPATPTRATLGHRPRPATDKDALLAYLKTL